MYYTIQAANNKDADQTARMRMLICVFVVRIWHKQIFSLAQVILNFEIDTCVNTNFIEIRIIATDSERFLVFHIILEGLFL